MIQATQILEASSSLQTQPYLVRMSARTYPALSMTKEANPCTHTFKHKPRRHRRTTNTRSISHQDPDRVARIPQQSHLHIRCRYNRRNPLVAESSLHWKSNFHNFRWFWQACASQAGIKPQNSRNRSKVVKIYSFGNRSHRFSQLWVVLAGLPSPGRN